MTPDGVVRQQDHHGCVIACIATVLEQPYGVVRAEFGEPGRGIIYSWWQEYLGRHGYAFQFFYRHNCFTKADREPWPLLPWTDLHFCCVDAGHGMGSHLVVMLRDGRVLDPASDEPRRITDYASVSYMAGLFQIGCSPAERCSVAPLEDRT
jgi:hypothetical protein